MEIGCVRSAMPEASWSHRFAIQDTTARLLTMLRILRHEYKSTLPAEIFLYPEEMTDPNERTELESLGAKLVEVKSLRKAQWEWKDFRVRATHVFHLCRAHACTHRSKVQLWQRRHSTSFSISTAWVFSAGPGSWLELTARLI